MDTFDDGDVNLDELPHVKTFMERIGYRGEKNEKIPERYVICPWPDPRECPVLRNDNWEIFSEEFVPSRREAMKIWELGKNGAYLNVTLYISSKGFSSSLKRFISIGSLSTSHILPYEKGPGYLGHYSALSRMNDNCRYFWVYHNTVFDIACRNSNLKIEELLKWYNRLANDHTREGLQGLLPSTGGIALSSANVQVGDHIEIRLDVPANVQTEFHWEGKEPRLVEESADVLVFRADEPLKSKITIFAADTRTFLVNGKVFTVEVKSR